MEGKQPEEEEKHEENQDGQDEFKDCEEGMENINIGNGEEDLTIMEGDKLNIARLKQLMYSVNTQFEENKTDI
jgi:hypothetical protein